MVVFCFELIALYFITIDGLFGIINLSIQKFSFVYILFSHSSQDSAIFIYHINKAGLIIHRIQQVINISQSKCSIICGRNSYICIILIIEKNKKSLSSKCML